MLKCSLEATILLLSVLLLLSSCSTLRPSGESPVIQAERHIERGEYKKGLDLFSGSCSKYREGAPAEECRLDAEQLRRTADKSYEDRQFAKAGALYRMLILSGSTDAPGTLSFTTEYLKERIGECSKSLTEEGLMRYREEKLDEAVSLWNKALSFDPENQSVKKAVNTANRQLQQLKNLNSD